MRKVAIFVEGQGDQIFVRNLLYHLIDPSTFSFRCFKLQAGSERQVPYEYPNPQAKRHFQIFNVQGDEGVLKAIQEREVRLFNQGFSKIIGLRDMYSKAYSKRSRNIDATLTQKFIEGSNATIAKMEHAANINFHFAIMEIEAWWLSMPHLFAKIDDRLTVEFIDHHLGYNLQAIKPSERFFQPASEIKKIFELIGRDYDKSRAAVETITSKITIDDITEATTNHKCLEFKSFCSDLRAS